MRAFAWILIAARLAAGDETGLGDGSNGAAYSPPGPEWNSATCLARIIAQDDGKMVRTWSNGQSGMFAIRFLIPDWAEGKDVSIDFEPGVTGVDNCWGDVDHYFEEGPSTLHFRLGAPMSGNQRDQVCSRPGP